MQGGCNCLPGNVSVNHGHFCPGDVHSPECRAGLGQDVSADEIGIALVIARDTLKHLSRAVAPIVLTTSGTCSGGASRIDSNGQNTVFACRRFDPLSHPPIRPRGGGYAESVFPFVVCATPGRACRSRRKCHSTLSPPTFGPYGHQHGATALWAFGEELPRSPGVARRAALCLRFGRFIKNPWRYVELDCASRRKAGGLS